MAGVSLVSGRQVDSRVELLVTSPALYLELRRVISSLIDTTPRTSNDNLIRLLINKDKIKNPIATTER
jgi:hypothetical protein